MGRRGGGGRGRSSNDDRSDSMNPQHPAYQASMDNRANQLNPEHEAFDLSRGKGGDNNDGDYDDDVEVTGEEPTHDVDDGIYFGEVSRKEESVKSKKPECTGAPI